MKIILHPKTIPLTPTYPPVYDFCSSDFIDLGLDERGWCDVHGKICHSGDREIEVLSQQFRCGLGLFED